MSLAEPSPAHKPTLLDQPERRFPLYRDVRNVIDGSGWRPEIFHPSRAQ